MKLIENLNETQNEIIGSANRVSRSPEAITLIAVTKKRSPEEIKTLIAHGINHIGENKVQELIQKYEEIGDGVTWHMIGHLQRNKVKYIVDKVSYIHSLDSYELAQEIEKRAGKINRKIKCLLEVNVSGEESKYGLSPQEVRPLLEKLSSLKHVTIVGLMTMAPFVENPEDARTVFKGLKALSEEMETLNLSNVKMEHLSMGMSNDFEVAIEEGATMVRIGSRLFQE